MKTLGERPGECCVTFLNNFSIHHHIMFGVSREWIGTLLRNCFASQWWIFDRVNIIRDRPLRVILIFFPPSFLTSRRFFFPLDSFVFPSFPRRLTVSRVLKNEWKETGEKKQKKTTKKLTQLDWFALPAAINLIYVTVRSGSVWVGSPTRPFICFHISFFIMIK